jgi:hypothetical protein
MLGLVKFQLLRLISYIVVVRYKRENEFTNFLTCSNSMSNFCDI